MPWGGHAVGQELERRRKAKKLHWMRAMYSLRDSTDAETLPPPPRPDLGGGVSWAAGSDEENDDGVDDLLAWSDTLDFDAYVEDWQALAISDRPGLGSASFVATMPGTPSY